MTLATESCKTLIFQKNGRHVNVQSGGEMAKNKDCHWDMLFVSWEGGDTLNRNWNRPQLEEE